MQRIIGNVHSKEPRTASRVQTHWSHQTVTLRPFRLERAMSLLLIDDGAIMRGFRLCSKSHNAQYTSTKIKAIPVRTDNAMQEILANSFL